MTESSDVVVRNNVGATRYEAVVQGLQCVADYVIEDNRIIFTHTFVPPELRGKGIAEKLVRAALDDARAQKLKVVPACSYVTEFVQRHAEYRDLTAL